MNSHTPLPRSFYTRPVITVARQLLGKTLVRRHGHTVMSGMIVEVEAYNGGDDPASHAFRGPTPRNQVMFLGGGILYVYFTYGMHFCANVVTGREGSGSAVLLRALEPCDGVSAMAKHRSRPASERAGLLSGPAKICQAMKIGRDDNGMDLCGDRIWIEDRGLTVPSRSIITSPRIGITRGKEKPWRFCVEGSGFLSRPADGS